ncbi:MAG: phosphatase PAP2 family protein [Armatimonadia bacterium]|nr:phosphatase PAP2 family protein [Armatimonadia bacterium]
MHHPVSAQMLLPAIILALLLCSPLLAQETSASADPVARWLNDHSDHLMEGTVAIMLLVGDHDTVNDAGVTLEGMVTSVAASEGLKALVDQPRPNDPSATDGFPSSHATAAFAFARGMTDWRSEWGLPVYTFAAGVGWSRVEEGYHTVDQVIAGAALGVWLAGVSLSSDGLVINRGPEGPTRPFVARTRTQARVFAQGTSVVLWKWTW